MLQPIVAAVDRNVFGHKALDVLNYADICGRQHVDITQLHVADRIELQLELDGDAESAIRKHEDYLKEQTLAVSVGYGASVADGLHVEETKLAGKPVKLGLRKT